MMHPAGPRPMEMAHMLIRLQRWIAATYPYWNRTGGTDHIWLFAHDEGACYAPKVRALGARAHTHTHTHT